MSTMFIIPAEEPEKISRFRIIYYLLNCWLLIRTEETRKTDKRDTGRENGQRPQGRRAGSLVSADHFGISHR